LPKGEIKLWDNFDEPIDNQNSFINQIYQRGKKELITFEKLTKK